MKAGIFKTFLQNLNGAAFGIVWTAPRQVNAIRATETIAIPVTPAHVQTKSSVALHGEHMSIDLFRLHECILPLV